MLRCERYFSQLKHDIEIPNGENARNWVANMVLKFHDDLTVNESEIVIFLRQVWWTAGKRKSFERRREKTKMRERRDIVSQKTDLTSLFIPSVRTTYYYSIYLFLIFYKKELYFIPYQMNKSNVLFFFFQIIISHCLFIYKNLIIFSKTLFI